MSIRTIGIVAAAFGLSLSTAWAQQPDEAPSVDAPEDWTVTVIELGYADAEEIAALLSEIVPPGVRVVPYYQTNSLVISGERRLVEELTGGDDGDEGGAENEASDRNVQADEGEITA